MVAHDTGRSCEISDELRTIFLAVRLLFLHHATSSPAQLFPGETRDALRRPSSSRRLRGAGRIRFLRLDPFHPRPRRAAAGGRLFPYHRRLSPPRRSDLRRGDAAPGQFPLVPSHRSDAAGAADGHRPRGGGSRSVWCRISAVPTIPRCRSARRPNAAAPERRRSRTAPADRRKRKGRCTRTGPFRARTRRTQSIIALPAAGSRRRITRPRARRSAHLRTALTDVFPPGPSPSRRTNRQPCHPTATASRRSSRPQEIGTRTVATRGKSIPVYHRGNQDV